MNWFCEGFKWQVVEFNDGAELLIKLRNGEEELKIWSIWVYSMLYCATQNRERLTQMLGTREAIKVGEKLNVYVGRDTGYVNWLIQDSHPFPSDIEHWIFPTENYVIEYLGFSPNIVTSEFEKMIEVEEEKVIEGIEFTKMSLEYEKERYKRFKIGIYPKLMSITDITCKGDRLEILMENEIKNYKRKKCYNERVLVTIESGIEAVRITENKRRLLLWLIFWNTKKYDPEDKYFFNVENSEFIRWLEEENGKKFERKVKHYCIFSSTFIVDVISKSKPKIKRLGRKERTI
ncbi:hypothetical protein [Caldicellulosiruptor naganoensis]|uniref:Uncharacterized protein n=1 Tax=Caldicellulosiruptor naganoensis TaxID=29324 RepID=A0ABY7BGR6_9FIRM|nr:hypothetical protein [Caldicellulosiruptor naganoensis]WAM32014.1 hypothetical protein OTJ99_000508 [Caldicellulosiruptor naganoensis]